MKTTELYSQLIVDCWSWGGKHPVSGQAVIYWANRKTQEIVFVQLH